MIKFLLGVVTAALFASLGLNYHLYAQLAAKPGSPGERALDFQRRFMDASAAYDEVSARMHACYQRFERAGQEPGADGRIRNSNVVLMDAESAHDGRTDKS